MNILSELRSIKAQVIELEANQKEKEEIKSDRLSSGAFFEQEDASKRLEFILYEAEKLMVKVMELQDQVINHTNDYN